MHSELWSAQEVLEYKIQQQHKENSCARQSQ